MKKFLLISFLFSAVFACKKDNKDISGALGPDTLDTTLSSTATYPVKLTSGNGAWMMTSMTVNPAIDFGDTLITDLYARVDACNLDDFYVFDSNGTGYSDEGATKCDPNDPQQVPFLWSFNSNNTVLQYTDSNISVDYSVVSMTNSQMILQWKDLVYSSHIITASYSHK